MDICKDESYMCICKGENNTCTLGLDYACSRKVRAKEEKEKSK